MENVVTNQLLRRAMGLPDVVSDSTAWDVIIERLESGTDVADDRASVRALRASVIDAAVRLVESAIDSHQLDRYLVELDDLDTTVENLLHLLADGDVGGRQVLELLLKPVKKFVDEHPFGLGPMQ